jgi:hypothetical protein
MLETILIIVAVVVIVFAILVGVVALLPAEFTVTRSGTISAPAGQENQEKGRGPFYLDGSRAVR